MATIPMYPSVRSRRFSVDVPLEVRSGDEAQWWPARTENVSATGILFRSATPIPPETPVELKFHLDVGDGSVEMTCSGTVARIANSDSDEAYVGVSLAAFNLLHQPAAAMLKAQTGGDLAELFHRLNTLLFIVMGNAEVVSVRTKDDALHATAATHILNAAEEAAAIVRTLVANFKQQQSR